MAIQKSNKIIHRSANGKVVDMDQLRQKHETTVAVGNIRVNARGDELGPGGVITKTRDEQLKEFYEQAEKKPTSSEE